MVKRIFSQSFSIFWLLYHHEVAGKLADITLNYAQQTLYNQYDVEQGRGLNLADY